MLSFLNRDYNEGRGMFFNGVNENSIFTFNPQEAKKRWNTNQDKMKKVSLIIPPKKKISFMIPIVED